MQAASWRRDDPSRPAVTSATRWTFEHRGLAIEQGAWKVQTTEHCQPHDGSVVRSITAWFGDKNYRTTAGTGRRASKRRVWPAPTSPPRRGATPRPAATKSMSTSRQRRSAARAAKHRAVQAASAAPMGSPTGEHEVFFDAQEGGGDALPPSPPVAAAAPVERAAIAPMAARPTSMPAGDAPAMAMEVDAPGRPADSAGSPGKRGRSPATADAAVRRSPRPKAVVPMPVELIHEEPVNLSSATERYLKTVANKRAYEVKKAARLARQAASRQAQALA
mgnify:FL=1